MKKLLLFFLFAIIGLFVTTTAVIAQEKGEVFADWEGREVLAAMTKRVGMPLPKLVADKDINSNEVVNQDLMMAGGNVDLGSVVNGDVFVVGGTVIVDGEIKGNLYVAGGQVMLRGGVTGKVIAVGGEVKIEEGAMIGGYLVAAGGKVQFLGRVDGDVRLAGGEATVAPEAVIGGSLLVDASKVTVASDARVAGEKQIRVIEDKATAKKGWSMGKVAAGAVGPIAGVFVILKLIGILGQILVLVLLVKVFGGHIEAIFKSVTKGFWSNLGWGFAKLFLTPILVILLLMTVVGMPAAGLVTLLYIGALFLANYIAAAIFGHLVHQKGWLKTKNIYLQASLGLVAIELVGLIPLIGWLVRLTALLTGLGVIMGAEKKLLVGAGKK